MKIHELISQPQAWSKFILASELPSDSTRPTGKNACSPFNEKAQCWCLEGAIERCYVTHRDHLGGALVNEKMREVQKQLADLIATFFPERISSPSLSDVKLYESAMYDPFSAIVIFNDHRDTTYPDVLTIAQLADV